MRTFTTLAAAILLHGATVTGAMAQTAQQVPSDSAVIARVIGEADHVRVRDARGLTHELVKPAIHGDSLRGLLADSAHTVSYPLRDVTEIRRRGSAVGQGFLIGGIAGAFAGGLLGAAAANMCPFGNCAPPSDGEVVGDAAKGAIVVGMIGGALGAIIGAPSHRWAVVYRREVVSLRPIVGMRRVGLSLRF